MKNIIIVLTVFSFSLIASAKESFTANCGVNFPVDSIDFSKQELIACLGALPKDTKPELINIFASASFPGSRRHNIALTEMRSEALKNFITKTLNTEDVKVNLIAGGETHFGRSAQVLVVSNRLESQSIRLASLEAENVAFTKEVKKLKTPSQHHVRVGALAGQSQYRGDDSRYDSMGGEVSYFYDLGSDSPFSLELGSELVKHSRDDVLDLYSLGAGAGVFAHYGWFVAGTRGTLSATTDSKMKKSVVNPGAEVRVGIEKSHFSTVAFAGISKDFNSFGISLGLKL